MYESGKQEVVRDPNIKRGVMEVKPARDVIDQIESRIDDSNEGMKRELAASLKDLLKADVPLSILIQIDVQKWKVQKTQVEEAAKQSQARSSHETQM